MVIAFLVYGLLYNLIDYNMIMLVNFGEGVNFHESQRKPSQLVFNFMITIAC